MQRNRGNGGQGLLGNAPLGFGSQSNTYGNSQSFGDMSGFGDGGSNGGKTMSSLSPRGFGNNVHNNHPRPEFIAKRMPEFRAGGGEFNNVSHGSRNSNNYYHQQQQQQPQQQLPPHMSQNNSSNMQGMPNSLQLQHQQMNPPQNQERQPMTPIGMSQGSNQVVNSPQQMNQLFNTDRDSQLALVNSLLKGNLFPSAPTNGMNMQANNNNNLQSPNNNNNNQANFQTGLNMNSQGMGIGSLGAFSHQGINGMTSGINMKEVAMQAAGGGLQGNGMQGSNVGNTFISNHLNQNQFARTPSGSNVMVSGLSNNAGNNPMAMSSLGRPGGNGHSILANPKAYQQHPQGTLGNSQGLFSSQQSLLGNPSLLRNADFLRQRGPKVGGLLSRNNNNNNNNNNNGRGHNYHNSPHRGGGHGYHAHMVGGGRGTPHRNITHRGRLDRRAPHNHRDRHDSRDSRDSHENRDGRGRQGGHDRRNIGHGTNKRDAEGRAEYSEKRQVALQPIGGDSLRVSVSDGQEEYDPAEPTEDHVEGGSTANSPLPLESELGSPEVNPLGFHAGQKRPRSHSPVCRSHTTTVDLKVTIDEKGRSVQDGPSQPKRRPSCGSDTHDGEDRKFTCHACSVDCKDLQHFESHMQSSRHRTRMESICSLHVQKTDQHLARMRAEEHLRRIEGREKEDYCRICDKRFVGSFITHRRGQEHRRKDRLTKRGCKLCRTGSFVQYCDYVKHIDSDPHKKNKEDLRKQEQSSVNSRKEDDDDTESFPDSFAELVTLDGTGIYKSDDRNEVLSEHGSNCNILNDEHDMMPVVCGKAANSEPVLLGNELGSFLLNMADDVKVQDKESTKQSKPNEEALVKGSSAAKEPLLPLPTFDPQVPIGLDHVVAMTGFFCKLCHQFFKSEDTALSLHSRTQEHFDMYMEYQRALSSKISKAKATTESEALLPTPLLVSSSLLPDGVRKTDCQSPIMQKDSWTELEIDQPDQLLHDVEQPHTTDCEEDLSNGMLINGSEKSDSLDEDFGDCNDIDNNAENNNSLDLATHNLLGESNDATDVSLTEAVIRTPLKTFLKGPDRININDDIMCDNGIILNGVDDNDTNILHKDSNGNNDDGLNDPTANELKMVQILEVKVGNATPKITSRPRRGRSRPGKRGRAK